MTEGFRAALRSLTERSHVRQAIRVLAASALSYGVSRLLGLPEAYWAIITAIIVTQPLFRETLAASGNRVLGTLIGALAGVAVIEGTRAGLPQQPLFWIAMIPLALLTAAWPTLRISSITLVIVSLIPSTASPVARALDRVWEILLAVLASIAVLVCFSDKPAPQR